MKYSFFTTVKKVFKHEAVVRVDKPAPGEQSKTHTENRGWFILLDGSSESLGIGSTEPKLRSGDKVKVTIEKV